MNYAVQKSCAGVLRARLLLLLSAFPLMGMQCVMSEYPLTAPEDGFIDYAAVGDWAIADEPGQEIRVSVGIDDNGMMTVRNYQRDVARSFVDYTGYSSKLGDQTFINLQIEDTGCIYCSDEHLAAAKSELEKFFSDTGQGASDSCSYTIIRYELTDDNTLSFFPLRADLVNTALDEQSIDGMRFPTDAMRYLADQPCIRSPMPALDAFVSGNQRELFTLAATLTRVRAEE